MVKPIACVILACSVLCAADAPTPALTITLDYSQAKDLEEWATKAGKLVEEWHPKVAAMLASDGFKPPMTVKLVFREMEGVAYAAGDTIHISAKWVRQQPGDFGMVVHELCHVIQSYPRNRPDSGWVVEGIADYIRFFHYEPQVKVRIDPQRSNYKKDSYRTAAAFLDYIARTHDKDLVTKLNISLRKGDYREEMFKELTGKTADELWAVFVATVKD